MFSFFNFDNKKVTLVHFQSIEINIDKTSCRGATFHLHFIFIHIEKIHSLKIPEQFEWESWFSRQHFEISVAERYLDTIRRNDWNKRGESRRVDVFVGTCPKFLQVGAPRFPLLFGVATPNGIVRVQRVQQHGMTTGSLILPRGSCMPPNGITPPRVIACECVDILATMGARSSIQGDIRRVTSM